MSMWKCVQNARAHTYITLDYVTQLPRRTDKISHRMAVFVDNVAAAATAAVALFR